MAKLVELLSKDYSEIRVKPAAAKTAGDMELWNDINGFYLVDFSAVQVAAAESAALIIQAQKVKIAKTVVEVWLPGEWLYWDGATFKATNVAGALKKIGYVYQNAANGDTYGYAVFKGHLYI